ncbi:MAG: helix-turn-helix transcriptional regulator [Xanthobacteraceae bacterium]|nr:helix-turn-helix transcriptional regulator [Xanthobacteraceae bacterium]
MRLYLREWRDYRQLTQERLAERLGTSTATVSRREAGSQGASPRVLGAYAEAFGCEPGDLFRPPPDPAQEEWRRFLARLPDHEKPRIKRLACFVIFLLTAYYGLCNIPPAAIPAAPEGRESGPVSNTPETPRPVASRGNGGRPGTGEEANHVSELRRVSLRAKHRRRRFDGSALSRMRACLVARTLSRRRRGQVA